MDLLVRAPVLEQEIEREDADAGAFELLGRDADLFQSRAETPLADRLTVRERCRRRRAGGRPAKQRRLRRLAARHSPGGIGRQHRWLKSGFEHFAFGQSQLVRGCDHLVGHIPRRSQHVAEAVGLHAQPDGGGRGTVRTGTGAERGDGRQAGQCELNEPSSRVLHLRVSQ